MVTWNYFHEQWGWSSDGTTTSSTDVGGKGAKRQVEASLDVDKAPSKRQTATGAPAKRQEVDGEDTINSSGAYPEIATAPDGFCVEGEDGCAFPGYDLSDVGGCWLS